VARIATLQLENAPGAAEGQLGDTKLEAIGALLANRGRARVLLALGDGRALPASALAAEAGVTPATASSHLARLVDGGLIVVAPRGRYRYYSLAGPAVGELIEMLGRLAPFQPVTSLREGSRAHAVRFARRCYDHLAGRLGVALAAAMIEQGLLEGHDGSVDLDRMTGSRPAGGVLDPVGYLLTDHGRTVLADLGVTSPRSPVVRCCVDWSEQRHHISGPLGRALLTRFTEIGWLRRDDRSRAVHLSGNGRAGLTTMGVTLP
jgi:DNA-binding transcriptional ArsR family regulator